MSAARTAGGMWGWITSFLKPTARARALDRLRLGLPKVDSKQRREILRTSLSWESLHQACLSDLRRLTPTDLCRRLSISGWENVNQLRKGDQGLVFVTAPFGCWELTLQPLVFGGTRQRLGIYPMSALATGSKQKYRLEAIDEGHLTTETARAIESGIDMLLVLDPGRSENTFIEEPFLGQTARIDATLTELLNQHQSPIIPIFGWAESRASHIVSVKKPISVRPNSDANELDFARSFLSELEVEIRAHPECWPWMRTPNG